MLCTWRSFTAAQTFTYSCRKRLYWAVLPSWYLENKCPKTCCHGNFLSRRDPPKFMHSGDLVACAWHDTKGVHFLGTVHNEFTVDKDIRHTGSEGGRKTVGKLVLAKRYNEDLAGNDKIDQLLGSYDYPHISKSGKRQLFTTVMREIALVSRYIILQKG